MPDQKNYIPALSFRWLTPLYDPLLKWGMQEDTFKRRLIYRANIQPGQKVLDLGCGTGTLTVMLKEAVPKALITGVDGDPEILCIARSKSAQAQAEITWDRGLAFDLPYADGSFDAVLSSLVIHHLVSVDKVRAFREVRRILRPGGRFHVLDFGPPFSPLTRIQAALMMRLEEAADNFHGRLLPMLKEAGFYNASAAERRNTVFGPIWFYSAVKTTD
jgi:ubiquinone/menaquinone biosynthesis C-methylase UbiE